MDRTTTKRRVAIACQGGGSHTAFTAGALRRLLRQKPTDVEFVGFSGTSGGAICALLTWYGLLTGDEQKAIALLESFWRANSANTVWDLYFNNSLQWLLRMGSVFPLPEVSPYYFPDWAQEMLRDLLNQHIQFDDLPTGVKDSSPALLIGAVNVLSGQFRVFDSRQEAITVEALLASAAIPNLFKAVQIGYDYYWDGLFSQNPPLRELTRLAPDEIWVIQINPPTRSHEPRSIDEIRDRRNELAGNLSLEQEIYFIEKINSLIHKGLLVDSHYKVIQVQRIMMLRDLDYSSKLDRSPSFIQDLIVYGDLQAGEFLRQTELRATVSA